MSCARDRHAQPLAGHRRRAVTSRTTAVHRVLVASIAMLASVPGEAADVIYVPVPVYAVYPSVAPWDYCAGLPRCAPATGYLSRVAERRRDRQRALAADGEPADDRVEFPLPRDAQPRPDKTDPSELQPRYRDAGNIRPEFSRTGRALDELRAEEEAAARAATARKEQRTVAPEPGSASAARPHGGQPPARAQAPEPQTRPMVLPPAGPSKPPSPGQAKPARDKPSPAGTKPKGEP
jgi:hypothetical protein